MNLPSIPILQDLAARSGRYIAPLLALLALGVSACQPEEQATPSTPNLDKYRLGTFAMEWNGQRLSGDLTKVFCYGDKQQLSDAVATFTFTEHSEDLYERRTLNFYAKGRVGRYEIDTIRPTQIHRLDWPYPEVSYHHQIEYGHVAGVQYFPILEDTIADFIAVDSIVDGVYHGRFQVSLVSVPERRREVPHAPDTVIIRDGRFAMREYTGE